MRPTHLLMTTIFLASSSAAFAVGSMDDGAPPKATETTTDCVDSQIFDPKAGVCVEAQAESLNDDTRYGAVRELAYAGEYHRAGLVMAAADNPGDARFLNYQGFISRKSGDTEGAMVFYAAALEQNPDYLLARSYMGQGLAATGDLVGAKAQLREISARGGKNTWAYFALKKAIVSGVQSNY